LFTEGAIIKDVGAKDGTTLASEEVKRRCLAKDIAMAIVRATGVFPAPGSP